MMQNNTEFYKMVKLMKVLMEGNKFAKIQFPPPTRQKTTPHPTPPPPTLTILPKKPKRGT